MSLFLLFLFPVYIAPCFPLSSPHCHIYSFINAFIYICRVFALPLIHHFLQLLVNPFTIIFLLMRSQALILPYKSPGGLSSAHLHFSVLLSNTEAGRAQWYANHRSWRSKFPVKKSNWTQWLCWLLFVSKASLYKALKSKFKSLLRLLISVIRL